MKSTAINGVYKDKRNLFTKSRVEGFSVYNEKIVKKNDFEYRLWNPYRSKLAAAILKDLKIDIKYDYRFLYLGVATGTTVSHISDILSKGLIWAVENSAISFKKLLESTGNRDNIIHIFEDAAHPDRYKPFVSNVDVVYQDISQRNQSYIFIENIKKYLKEGGIGILMVKARSINVALKPKEAYEKVELELEDNGFIVDTRIDLSPYEKDHAVIKIST